MASGTESAQGSGCHQPGCRWQDPSSGCRVLGLHSCGSSRGQPGLCAWSAGSVITQRSECHNWSCLLPVRGRAVWFGVCVCVVFFFFFRCKFLLPEGEKSPSCQIIIVRLQVLLSHRTGSASPGLFSKRGGLAFGRRKVWGKLEGPRGRPPCTPGLGLSVLEA